MRYIFLILSLSIFFFQVPSQAKLNEKLKMFFESEIQKMNQAIDDSEIEPVSGSRPDTNAASGIAAQSQDEMWFLSRFRLYFKASAGFEVDGLTQLLVQPEVELLFQRYPAPGWAPYRPANLNGSR